MRLKNSYFHTIRENIKDEEITSGKLLVKSGMVKKTASGIYMFMPLGYKVKQQVENIIREEMDKTGAQEVLMPQLIAGDIFVQSGRRNAFGDDMFSLKDRYDRDYVLGPTHEELFVIAAKEQIKSYKDMPFNLYQIGNKYRDEMRPRYGLIRTREFTMKDAYSFDIDKAGVDVSYDKMATAYNNIFDRFGIDYRVVRADTGAMGGELSEEYQAISEIGEDTLVLCDNCDFASNIEIAGTIPRASVTEKEKQMKLVETPGVKTIDDIANFLKIDVAKTVKTLVCNADGEIIVALIRGDRELNDTKLRKLLNVREVNMATEEELKTIADGTFGSLGPIGINARIITDNEIESMTNFVVGANRTGYHYINVNLKDFKVSLTGDITNIKEGDTCPKCHGKIHFKKGIEIGNLFKLGDKYSKSLNLTYLDKNNKPQYVQMGCYGIGTARCISAIVEQNHDDKGIVWPKEVAPFRVAIVVINTKNEKQMKAAEELYNDLTALNIDTLLDDRDERPGVKFNDMDLIGIPVRITIGNKIEDDIIEIKTRNGKVDKTIKLEELEETLKEVL